MQCMRYSICLSLFSARKIVVYLTLIFCEWDRSCALIWNYGLHLLSLPQFSVFFVWLSASRHSLNPQTFLWLSATTLFHVFVTICNLPGEGVQSATPSSHLWPPFEAIRTVHFIFFLGVVTTKSGDNDLQLIVKLLRPAKKIAELQTRGRLCLSLCVPTEFGCERFAKGWESLLKESR